MEDKVGYVKTEEGIKDVETCEPPQDIKQQEVIEEQAGNSSDGKSLDEECGDLRSVRDFLQTRVKELETQFQLAEETKDEICVYLEEQLYSLDTKIRSLRTEIYYLHDAQFSDTSKMRDEFINQNEFLKEQLLAEVMAIEQKFFQMETEMRIHEEVQSQVESIIDDQIPAAESENSNEEIPYTEEKLISEKAAMVKESEQSLCQAANIERNCGHKNAECLQTDVKMIINEAKNQIALMIDDQFVKLSHQSQSLTVDVSEMLEENTRKSSALWKELKANIDYYEEQVMREIDAMEQRFKFVDENLTEVTEQLTTHKLTEDEIIRDLEHRIDALNVEAEKRQRAWRFWEFVSSTNEVSTICPALIL